LGVVFDKNLNFKLHINQIIHKANNMLGIIKQTFNFRDPAVMRCILYTILVRPILDYPSTIWNPYQLGVICELENVQKEPLS